MNPEMAPEPCGDPYIDADLQAFMDIHRWKQHGSTVWPKGLAKPMETIQVVDELL